MGTHVKGPSRVSHPKELSGKLLSDWLRYNRWALGDRVATMFGDDQLPFLFKVLSINKSLSIQAHPSKDHAKALHRISPQHYHDTNHKPELAIAISHFEGFCGFRPFEEIQKFVVEVVELGVIVGEKVCVAMRDVEGGMESKRSALRMTFTSLMECGEELVAKTLGRLVGRVHAGNSGDYVIWENWFVVMFLWLAW